MNDTPKKPRRKLVRILLVLVLLGIAFRVFALAPIVKSVAEAKIGEAITTEARIVDVDLCVLGGAATIEGLEIDNPAGFSEPMFVSAGSLSANVSLWSLISGPIEIENVSVSGTRVVVEMPKEGELNISQIMKKPEGTGETSPLPDLLLTLLEADGTEVVFVDRGAEGRVAVEGIDVRVTRLRTGAEQPMPESDLRVEAAIPGDNWPGSFYLRGWATPLGTSLSDLPDCDLGGHLGGFELALVDPWVTPVGRTLLGGDAIDVSFRVQGRDGAYLGEVSVATNTGSSYTLTFSWREGALSIDKDSMLLQAFSLPLQRLLGLGSIVEGSLEDVVGGVEDAVGELAGGIGGVGEGLAGLGENLTEGDVVGGLESAGEGVLGLGDSLFGAVGGLVGGAGDAVGVTGDDDASRTLTREEVAARHAEACKALDQRRLDRFLEEGVAVFAEALGDEMRERYRDKIGE